MSANGDFTSPRAEGFMDVRLPYRQPFDWQALLGFFAPRAVPGVERVALGSYARTIEVGGRAGWIEVEAAERKPHLRLRVAMDPAVEVSRIVERVRRLFDLDADPRPIAAHLSKSRRLSRLVAARPGLRVPGAWNGFEIAVRAILGQQVSVGAATTLAGRLVARFGRSLPEPAPGLTHLFPTAEALAAADLGAIGLPRARSAALGNLARAFVEGRIRLDSQRSLGETIGALEELPGVGPWTAQYVALRALGEADAFPAGDLGIRRALGNGRGPLSENAVAAMAEKWRPWRAYATLHLWQSLADGLKGSR